MQHNILTSAALMVALILVSSCHSSKSTRNAIPKIMQGLSADGADEADSEAVEEADSSADEADSSSAKLGGEPATGGGLGTNAKAKGASALQSRQLVYKATLDLEVDDVAAAAAEAQALVSKMGGYLATSRVTTDSASGLHSGDLTLKVPAAGLGKTLAHLRGIGTVLSSAQETEDVTRNYVDLDARRKNLALQEERLRALLTRAGKLADILATEKELARVRLASETAESEFKALSTQIALATITVSLEERHLPLGRKIASTFHGTGDEAIEILVASVHAMILFFAGFAPWAVPVALLVWAFIKLRRRRHAAKTAAPASSAA